MGVHSTYTDEIADEICERLSEGESLSAICIDEHLPSRKTVYRWLDEERYSVFRHRYIRARERQAETFIDQCVDIADGASRDTIIKTTKSGEEYETPNHEYINRSRLRVETRLKLAEKLYPKKYTPKRDIKQETEHTFSDETRRFLDKITNKADKVWKR